MYEQMKKKVYICEAKISACFGQIFLGCCWQTFSTALFLWIHQYSVRVRVVTITNTIPKQFIMDAQQAAKARAARKYQKEMLSLQRQTKLLMNKQQQLQQLLQKEVTQTKLLEHIKQMNLDNTELNT